MDAFYLNQDHPTKTEFVLTTWNMLRERNMFFLIVHVFLNA